MINDPGFCLIPFSSLSISPSGHLRPCCVMKASVDAPTISSSENINWPTKQIKNLQQTMTQPDREKTFQNVVHVGDKKSTC